MRRSSPPNWKHTQREEESKSKLIWIVLGIILTIGLIFGIYFFTKSNNSSTNDPNIQYLPSEEEAQVKINQIKTNKGIDEQQATIEFLTSYVPEIKWWEINSLSELDERIKLVNNKTGFPPFKEVPKVDKFNREVEGNMQKKVLMFLASIIPRQADNTPDWKGIKDFRSYMLTVMKPLMEGVKFKPAFATQKNYQELERRINEEINLLLSSLSSQFSSLSSVSELNALTETLLSKFFQGHIYGEVVHDELGKQLAIANHKKYEPQKTDNNSTNRKWGIVLHEIAFQQSS